MKIDRIAALGRRRAADDEIPHAVLNICAPIFLSPPWGDLQIGKEAQPNPKDAGTSLFDKVEASSPAATESSDHRSTLTRRIGGRPMLCSDEPRTNPLITGIKSKLRHLGKQKPKQPCIVHTAPRCLYHAVAEPPQRRGKRTRFAWTTLKKGAGAEETRGTKGHDSCKVPSFFLSQSFSNKRESICLVYQDRNPKF
jgi:hypothetical protein